MADSIASIASTLSIGLYIACCSNEFLPFGIHAQVTARPISVLMGLESRTNFLLASATYRELLALPFDTQLQELQRPDTKAAILGDLDLSQLPTPILSDLGKLASLWRGHAVSARQRNVGGECRRATQHLSRKPGLRLADRKRWQTTSVSPRAQLRRAQRPRAARNARFATRRHRPRHAGAHCGVLCDASMPAFLLTHWRNRGEQGFPLEHLVHQLTQRTARAWGFNDRGVIAAVPTERCDRIPHEARPEERQSAAHETSPELEKLSAMDRINDPILCAAGQQQVLSKTLRH